MFNAGFCLGTSTRGRRAACHYWHTNIEHTRTHTAHTHTPHTHTHHTPHTPHTNTNHINKQKNRQTNTCTQTRTDEHKQTQTLPLASNKYRRELAASTWVRCFLQLASSYHCHVELQNEGKYTYACGVEEQRIINISS